MAYRFKTRSTTPGQRRLSAVACANLFAEQLATDVIAVNAGKSGMTTATTILSVVGTLDMSLYALISGIVGPQYVLAGRDNYVGGAAGTLTLPAEANTWYGSGAYGVGGNGSTPSKRASSIANCSAGNVKDGVSIDDVAGTFTHTSDYVLISAVVSPSWVTVGHYNYVGGSEGEYPSISTSKAEQYEADVAIVAGHVADIRFGTTILTVEGSLVADDVAKRVGDGGGCIG